MKLNLKPFYDLANQRYLTVQKHETADLLIWNYSPRCQFERFWTEETSMARGLITDSQGEIIARPFKKFFNLSEHTGEDSKLQPLPLEPFNVYDKLDGSLGILYWIDNAPFLATRGSFVSDQALKGTEMFRKKYSRVFQPEKGVTYLFEIIYPQNRIVVDYKGLEDVILLSAIDNDTGQDRDLLVDRMELLGVPTVKKIFLGENSIKLEELSEYQKDDNREGYVIRFRTGVRAKVKFDEYVRLHRLLTGVNSKTIWDLLRNEQPFDELLERVPDEYYEWVKKTKEGLEAQFKEIQKEASEDMFKVMTEIETVFGDGTGSINEDKVAGTPELRKFFAEKAKKAKYAGVLFAMLSHKNWKDLIWKMLKPVATKPFREDIDL